MSTTIESLEARLATVERLIESVPEVRDARYRIAQEERRERERAFANAPATERNAAIAAMTDTEVRQAIGALSEDDQARVLAEATEDLRTRVRALIPSSKRLDVLLEIEVATREGTVPHYVRVCPALHRDAGGVRDMDVPVSEAHVPHLRALGLDVENPNKKHPTSHTWQRPSLGERGEWTWSQAQWTAITAIDRDLGARVAEGSLIVEDLTPGQDLSRYRNARLPTLQSNVYSAVTGAAR